MKLEGEKIYLKPMSVKDAEIFFKWVNDPEVNKYMLLDPPKTIHDEINWIEETLANPNEEVWSIYIKENDKLIGNTGLHNLGNKDKNFTVGIIIGEKDEWGKGYGTDVFKVTTKYLKEQKGAQKINLSCNIKNVGAHKVYVKSGFKIKDKRKMLNERTKKEEDMYYMELED